MAWRKWIVRGVVYGIIGAAASGALLYQRLTNPGAVRDQVIAKLSETFPGAHVSVDSARLRILGGIQLNGLRMTHNDDPEKLDFVHVPSAIFYHDKEKILDGELTLRKIELIRPRLRVRRQRDGTWNLQGLLRPQSRDKPQTHLPAIVIHQGTLILEDRSELGKAAALEINDVSLTLLNDPLPTVTIRGAASSDLLGKLILQGSLERHTNEAFLSFRATQIPLTHTLAERLLSQVRVPRDLLIGLELSAMANVEGNVSYHPSQPQPVYYDVHCEVRDGNVKHPRLPLPFLEGLQLKLHCHNGELHLQKLSARCGETEVAAHAMAQLPRVDQDFEAHLDLKHVVLGKDLAERLPDKIKDLYEMFRPNGPTSIHIACAKNDGQWVDLAPDKPSKVSLLPENISLAFMNFPYLLERANGKVDYHILNKHVEVDIQAHAGDRPVLLNGHWTGNGPQADVKFEISCHDLPIDDKLLQALTNPTLRAFAESLHATGKFGVNATIRHEPGKVYRNVYHVVFKDATVKADNFPYALTQVSGFLDIFPEHWEFHDFKGTHNGGRVLVHGKSIPKDDKAESHGISLEITGHNIELDEDLREALRPIKQLHDSWGTFRPHGNLYFTASVRRPSANLRDLEVHVDARGCSAKPTFFPYEIQDISGQFRFQNRCLEIAKVRAKHQHAIIALDHAKVDVHERGGYYADFADLDVRGFELDDEFIAALPGKLQSAAKVLHLKEPLKLKTRVVIAQPPETGKPPDVYWDCQAWMYDAKFSAGLDFRNVTGTLACIGRYNGRQIVGVDGNLIVDQATLFDQTFKNVHAKIQMRETSPDIMLVGVRAPIYGGDVTGQVRVNFNSALDYEMNLTASQINVAEFGRQNLGAKSQLSGTANARLYLKGLGTSTDARAIDSLDGNGSIDIPRGHLYNLPFLLDLLKFLGLHWPDRTAFEEFHAAYSIQGAKVNVHRLDLLGSAVSLSGKGDFDLGSKKLELDIYPMWGRIEQLLPAQVRPFPTTLSKNLLTVEVRGKVSSNPQDLKYHMKPMPVIVDPLLLLRDRMMGQSSRGATVEARGPAVDVPPAPARKSWFRIWE